MSAYRVRVRPDAGGGFWCTVRFNGCLVSEALLPCASAEGARAEGRELVAKHQAERRLARAA